MIRVYVIHVPEDIPSYDKLAGECRGARLSAEFDRMQVKQPWVPAWKTQTWNRIYKCDGVIVLLSKNTNAGGIAWELECAQKFDLPMLGIHVDKTKAGNVPDELRNWTVIEWSWAEISKFIRSLDKGSTASA